MEGPHAYLREVAKAKHERCSHGVPLYRDEAGALPYCPECELIWHTGRIAEARAAVARHQVKIAELVAEISRTCGDA